MDRAQKEALVAEMKGLFGEVNLLVVTQQSGLTVSEATSLRRQMRDAGASYKVCKNRLVRLALEGTRFEALAPLFTGPTAIASSADPVAAAKVCVDFAKGNNKLTIVGGALGESLLQTADVEALAKLPSLDELRGKLIGVIQAPAGKLASVTQAPAAQLARVFSAYGSQDEAA
ncbi:MAG: 50S ribosomal protein L10 [Kiloniellales bacterium]|nr:50S ribosomal protein L10 [Kiloniellales bacterium]